MASERQIRANRANATKSTGPKTLNGKTVSSRNAVRHGLTAQQVVGQGGSRSVRDTASRTPR